MLPDVEAGGGVELGLGVEGVGGGAAGREGEGGRQVVRACELNPSCSVCLLGYYLNEEVTLLPCGHLYHTEVGVGGVRKCS